IRASILTGSATLQKTLLNHTTDDIGQRRPVDPRPLDKVCLAQSFVLRHGQQNGILARGKLSVDLSLKHVAGALARTMQEMYCRSIELVRLIELIQVVLDPSHRSAHHLSAA